MKPSPRYETEPYLKELDTRVLKVGEDSQGSWALLEETIFYPEGGGQPPDHGRIAQANVVDVRKGQDGSRHYFQGRLEPGSAHLRLDWSRRYDHMQQHTAQHLITALASDRFGWKTTSFHLGPEQCDIELDVDQIGDDQLLRLEDAVAEAVRSALPVTGRRVSTEEFSKLDVRTRGLPKDHAGSIRLVEISGIDLNTCGGTHVRSTAELEAVKLLGTESVRGQTRLFYVAGSRTRSRLASDEAILGQLRRILDTGNDELPLAAQRALDQNRLASKELKALETDLAAELVRSLLKTPEKVVSGHYHGRSLPFLQQIARQVVSQDPGRVLLLTTGEPTEQEGTFVLAAGEASDLALQETGSKIAEILEGRGGGRPPIFQGKASRIDLRDQALQWLERNGSPPGSAGEAAEV